MPITRIKNNQVTDSSAGNLYLGINAAAKLQDYSITSGKIANSLVYGSDLTVTGNLTVNGQTTTIDTVSVVIEDPILYLAANQTGAPSLDIGFIGERGTSQNIAFVWDESLGEFVTVYTNDTTTNTTVTIASYASFKTLNAAVTGNLTVTGTTSLTGNISLGNVSATGQINATGNISGGNLISNAAISAATTLSVTGNATLGNISTAGLINATGNISGGNLISNAAISAATTLSVTGNANVGNLGTTGLINAVGNITGGNIIANGAVLGNIQVSGNINVTNIVATGFGSFGTTVSATGNITGGNLISNAAISGATLTTTGNALIGGNLVVQGNLTYINIDDLRVEDPVIIMGTGPNGAPLTTDDGMDRGIYMEYYKSAALGNASVFWDNSTGNLVAATSVNFSGNNIINVLQYGTFQAGNIFSQTVLTTGNITGGNIVTGGLITATGNINTSANLNALSGNINAQQLLITGNGTVIGTFTSTSNIVANVSGIFFGQAPTGNLAIQAGVSGFTSLGSNIVAQFSGNTNSYSQINFENINSGNRASTDYVATADNGSDSTFFIDMGIGSSTHDDPAFFGDTSSLNDGYLYVVANAQTGGSTSRGNLMLGSTNGNIKMFVGNTAEASVRAVASTQGFDILNGNLYVTSINSRSGRITVNASDADVDFAVDGDTTANVFYVDAGTGTVSFGSSTQTTNAIASFNATTSILTPVGNTAQRPTGVTGMVRFNTTTSSLEFYDSTQWVSTGTIFTVVQSQTFNGDGSTVAFTINAGYTTASCLVSINGILQVPITAYAVAGTTLTFTEAPALGDLIEVREITTTVAVKSITNANGSAVIEVSDSTTYIQTTGNILPSGNVLYNLGSDTARFKDLYLSGSSLILGNIVLKNTSGNTLSFFGPDGTTPGTLSSNNVDTTSIANGTSNVQTLTSGAVTLSAGGNANVVVVANGSVTVKANILNGQANGVGNIGNSTTYFNTIFAKATSAQYADLAENYEADATYEPGTVVCFGGNKEITFCDQADCTSVAGVISTNPSYLMNSGQIGAHVAAVALQGRVPTKVTGQIRKGDLMVAAGDGRAKSNNNARAGTIIGKALADFDGQDGVIEVVVGRV